MADGCQEFGGSEATTVPPDSLEDFQPHTEKSNPVKAKKENNDVVRPTPYEKQTKVGRQQFLQRPTQQPRRQQSKLWQQQQQQQSSQEKEQ